MSGNEKRPPPPQMSLSAPRTRPTLILPPRAPVDSLLSPFGFGFGFSPGPMTLVSSFFADNDECKSFSQLLAGAMASPAARHRPAPDADCGAGPKEKREEEEEGKEKEKESSFKRKRPEGLVVSPQPPPPLLSPMFAVTPGLSPAVLLDSPGIFSPGRGPFGMTHQEALAQVTAQAQSLTNVQTEYSSLLSTAPAVSLAMPQQSMSLSESSVVNREPLDLSQADNRPQPSSYSDKPAGDGYNWRKYGQKQVKGSEYPRSYYKCTHPRCPVKKKVERTVDGHVTEIIYKGQHNHPRPQNKRGGKDATSGGNPNFQENRQGLDSKKLGDGEPSNLLLLKDQESSQVVSEHLPVMSDSDEAGTAENEVEDRYNDEPDAKRITTEVRVVEPASSHKAVTEPRIIVQTTSEVDLLDDGYRWRKYGQKVVKGNPYPRSYYKCTTLGCNVRKHVERASTDPKAVITTYEGKHNHDVPAARGSSHSIANPNLP